MQPFSRGQATIVDAKGGGTFTIDGSEVEWEVAGVAERDMGPEVHHRGTVLHDVLGEITWNLWEYPVGAENYRSTEAEDHYVQSDLNYGLEHTPEEDAREAKLQEVIEWFHENYEDPAQRTSYMSSEGGYLWNHGGPFDARDVIEGHFSDLPEDLIDEAVEEVQREGTYEWAAGDWWDREDAQDIYEEVPEALFDDEELVIPPQGQGVQFAILADGLIGIDSSGDEPTNPALRSTTLDAVRDLEAALSGSNAYATIVRTASRYREAMEADPPSIELLYALGVRLENARHQIRIEVDSGDYPPMGPMAGEALDSVLALHGPLILSTARGRELVELAREYAGTSLETEAYRVAAQGLAVAVAGARNLVGENARDFVVQANADVQSGPHPERSNEVAHTSNRNLLVRIATVVGPPLLLAAVEASVPGAAVVATGTQIINVAWDFLLSHMPMLREFAAASGPDMTWLASLLDRLQRSRQ